MIAYKLTIKRADDSTYWTAHFPSQNELDKWLEEEQTRPYWDNSWTTETETVGEANPTPDAWEMMRMQRDALLAACDYIIMPDYPMVDKSAWETYRAELRDLPENIVDINDIQWPTKP